MLRFHTDNGLEGRREARAPNFSLNTSGLDTTAIGAEGLGSILEIAPPIGATLGAITITNPGSGVQAAIATIPDFLSGNNNIVDSTGSLALLGLLQNNGGPTLTMVPQTGSAALCAITPSNATGTDQRGQPRAVPYGGSTCQDAGSVQTSY